MASLKRLMEVAAALHGGDGYLVEPSSKKSRKEIIRCEVEGCLKRIGSGGILQRCPGHGGGSKAEKYNAERCNEAGCSKKFSLTSKIHKCRLHGKSSCGGSHCVHSLSLALTKIQILIILGSQCRSSTGARASTKM